MQPYLSLIPGEIRSVWVLLILLKCIGFNVMGLKTHILSLFKLTPNTSMIQNFN